MRTKKVFGLVSALMLSVTSMTPAFACTPKLNSPSVNIPDITVKIDDGLENAISDAAKKFLEKNSLEKPTIQNATHIRKTFRCGVYGCLNVCWNKIENATYYEVDIMKVDGSKKTYTTPCNVLVKSNYCDEFVLDGMYGATVKVKAYGEDETFSLWSDVMTITNLNF